MNPPASEPTAPLRRPAPSKLPAWVVAGLSVFAPGLSALAEGGPRIAIVAPPEGKAIKALETRLRAELLAAGFEVVVISSPSPPTPESLEALAVRNGTAAAIAFVRAPGGQSAEVWISDRITGKVVLRHLPPVPSGTDEAALFALRAVELLRGSLLELREPHPPRGDVQPPAAVSTWLAPAPPPPPPASAEPREPPAPAPAPARFGGFAGVGVLGGPGGVPTSAAPMLGASWTWSSRSAAEAVLMAPATSVLSAPEGTTSISQALFLARGRLWVGDADQSIRPELIGGGGVYRISAAGSAVPPFRSEVADATALLLLGGVGLRARLGASLSLVAEGSCVVVGPRPVLVLGERPAAKTGLPLFVGAASLQASF